MQPQYTFELSQFQQLSLEQLYQILTLRQQVFMLEQNSLYLDLDGLDQQALHLCCWCNSQLAAYSRIRILPGKKQAKIERVVVAQKHRGQGLADKMMTLSMQHIRQQPVNEVRLSAQVSVLSFYQKWQFVTQGEVYDDGGVPHQDMCLQLLD